MTESDPSPMHFAARALGLSRGGTERRVSHDGASIWCASDGPTSGRPVILLHGGLGHCGNFAHQIPVDIAAGHRAVVIDSRGYGRSTRDAQPYPYGLMACDVVAEMDALGLASGRGRGALVGWSDGACIALTLAKAHPERVAGIFCVCNLDPQPT